MTCSLSQNCIARLSAMRPRTNRVGLLQSERNIGSQTTKTFNFSDRLACSTRSAAEAPREHAGHVGESSSTMRALSAAPSNACLNWAGLSGRIYVSGGCPLGVRPDHRKYQETNNTT